MPQQSQADRIRRFAVDHYVAPWREAGGGEFLRIRAGDVARDMHLHKAVSNVCNALRGRKFENLAGLELTEREGPVQSTTTVFHYRDMTTAKTDGPTAAVAERQAEELREAPPAEATAHPAVQRPAKDVGEVLLSAEHISLSFGAVRALTDVSVEVREREVLAIIGPNGAGKTSLLNCINGVYRPQHGRIVYGGETRGALSPADIARQGIARTFQNVALFRGMTTLDNIMTGRNTKIGGSLFSQALYWGRYMKEELAHRRAVEEIIDFLEIQDIRKTPVGRLPYGLQKRVELGRALAAEPRLLLLDEPMAGMNVEEKEDMSRFVLDVNDEFGTTIVLIEHDMGVVMDISDRVVVLDYGRAIADGSPDAVRRNPAVIDAYLGVST